MEDIAKEDGSLVLTLRSILDGCITCDDDTVTESDFLVSCLVTVDNAASLAESIAEEGKVTRVVFMNVDIVGVGAIGIYDDSGSNPYSEWDENTNGIDSEDGSKSVSAIVSEAEYATVDNKLSTSDAIYSIVGEYCNPAVEVDGTTLVVAVNLNSPVVHVDVIDDVLSGVFISVSDENISVWDTDANNISSIWDDNGKVLLSSGIEDVLMNLLYCLVLLSTTVRRNDSVP